VTVRVAACAYPIEAVRDFATFAEKQAALVRTAVEHGARLLVFPEYASVELTAALPSESRGDLSRELRAIQTFGSPLETLYGGLAREEGVYILAPSFPVLVGADSFHNRALLHTPSGVHFTIDKRQMTRFEREDWGISGGDGGPVIETEFGVIGIAICYDSEFPLIVRRQVARGASIILVPSCTDTLAGYHRVALSCRARALENQCFVLQAPTVGDAPWSLALDHNHGSAAVFGPVDYGFASDGVIAQGALDAAGWVYADLDVDSLARVRETGQVTNHADWDLPGHLEYEPDRVRADSGK
jgi:predicted amidohydrolase